MKIFFAKNQTIKSGFYFICQIFLAWALCFLGFGVVMSLLNAQEPENILSWPENIKRVVVVLSSDWEDSSATLYCLERSDEQKNWQLVMHWPVKVGRSGLGWGKSPINQELQSQPQWLHIQQQTPWPQKQEGDGKAPAGIIPIRCHLYGYDAYPPEFVQWPYTQVTSDWIGIDDVKSQYYNQLLNRTSVLHPDWNSYEDLRRRDHVYHFFLMVEHNTQPVPIPGAGSCIFLHVWYNPDKATAGCTSMSEEKLLQLVQWLQVEKSPLLIQFPRSIYRYYHNRLGFPELD